MVKLRFADPRPDVKSRSLALTPLETYLLGNQKSKLTIGIPVGNVT